MQLHFSAKMFLTVRFLYVVVFFASIYGSLASESDYEEFEHAGPPTARKSTTRASQVQRIHNGELSHLGDYKFIVGLRVRAAIADPTQDYEDDVSSLCTGTLVASRFVLTASHCLPRVVVYLAAVGENAVEGFSYSNVRIEFYAGTIDLVAPKKGDVNTQRIIAWYPSEVMLHVHPQAFDFRKVITDRLRGKLMKDFLLLELIANSFTFNEYVEPIPILKMPIPKMMNGNCKAMGFGNQDDMRMKRDSKLYHVDVKVGGVEFCDELRGKAYNKTYHLCAFGEGMRDTCSGDSGGPLVCGQPGGRYIVGVLSMGTDNVNRKGVLKGCGETNTSFSVYVYPGFVEDWVSNITKDVQYITMDVAENLRDHPVTYPVTTTTSEHTTGGSQNETMPPSVNSRKAKERNKEMKRASNESNSLHSTWFGERITEALFIWATLWNMHL